MSRRHVYAVIDNYGDTPRLYERKAAADRRAKRLNAAVECGRVRYVVRRLPVYTSATRKARRKRI